MPQLGPVNVPDDIYALLLHDAVIGEAVHELGYGKQPLDNAVLEHALDEMQTELEKHPCIHEYFAALYRIETKDTALGEGRITQTEGFLQADNELVEQATAKLAQMEEASRSAESNALSDSTQQEANRTQKDSPDR